MIRSRRPSLAAIGAVAALGAACGVGDDVPATASTGAGADGATTTTATGSAGAGGTVSVARDAGSAGGASTSLGGAGGAGGAPLADAGAADAAGPPGPVVTGSFWIDAPGAFPSTGKGSFVRHQEQPKRVACGLPESAVYHTTLTHTQDADHAWSLRIGKGSAIYSIHTALGELVGAQACNPDHPGPWVDRVLQTVLVSTAKNSDPKPYFIHQAGTYEAPAAGLATPFWSPLLGESLDAGAATYRTIVWPQQAHVYAGISWRSEVLLQQSVRDAGDGIVELTWVATSFGDDVHDHVSQPWIGLSSAVAPMYARGTAQGGRAWYAPASWSSASLAFDATHGWVAVEAEQAPTARGLAVVFGAPPGNNAPGATLRFGPGPAEDLTILSAIPRVPVAAHATSWWRAYLVVGRLAADHHPRGNELSAFVAHGTLSFDPTKVGAIDPCSKAPGAPGCASFYALDRPAGRARPVLALRDLAKQRTIVSTDPYALSPTPWKGDTTRYLALLGWGVDADVAPGPGFVRLGSLLADPADYPDPAKGRDVWVLAR